MLVLWAALGRGDRFQNASAVEKYPSVIYFVRHQRQSQHSPISYIPYQQLHLVSSMAHRINRVCWKINNAKFHDQGLKIYIVFYEFTHLLARNSNRKYLSSNGSVVFMKN